jgi:predicted nucleotidyltransferase
MIDIQIYMSELIDQLKNAFDGRLLYVGLQGSYMRGEATEESDMDAMVVLENMTVRDLDVYRSIIMSLGDYEKSCGFICGRAELAGWNPLEICHVLHTTKDCYGTLSNLVPSYDKADIQNYIKVSVGNLYHEICHRYIHADADANRRKLPFTYKGVFFILQNVYYLKTGVFAMTKKELLTMLLGEDRAVMETAMQLSEGGSYDFDRAWETLFCWCASVLKTPQENKK